MTYANREVFVHAPLAIVTAEVQLNYEPRINDEATRARFAEEIRPLLPVLERQTVNAFTLQPAEVLQKESIQQIRATSLDKSITAILHQTSLSISMDGKSYSGFSSFTPLFDAALAALTNTIDSVVVKRVGLRYIDEVRVDSPPEHTGGWSPWINSALLAPVMAYGESKAEVLRGNVIYNPGDDRKVIFNWGEFVGSGVVGPDVPFHNATLAPSKLFLLDVDSAWEPSDFVLLDREAISKIMDRLHDPIGEIFQWSVTEQAREVFRGNSVRNDA
jgi:uncharacterized protein (TIGR04255 family)